MATEYLQEARALKTSAKELEEKAANSRERAEELEARAQRLRDHAAFLQREEELDVQQVLVPNTGTAYHDAWTPCQPGTADGRQMTRGEARKLGRKPCGNCRRFE
jgi:hypothetical protein